MTLSASHISRLTFLVAVLEPFIETHGFQMEKGI